MALPLEDFYEDIIGKAQRGLGLSDGDLLSRTGLNPDQLSAALEGHFDPTVAAKLAPALHLNTDALLASGGKSWHPGIHSLPDHFWQVTTNYHDIMSVNAYVLAHPATGDALIFDSGANANPILELIQKHHLCAAALLITHGHGDHILEVPTLKRELALPVFAHRDGARADQSFSWGDTLKLAGFEIHVLRTSGHAADGTTFLFSHSDRSIAITGDALFAGSMGGANKTWKEALTHTRENILSLPDPTLLCPGHGPVTTVALEKKHNPFFA